MFCRKCGKDIGDSNFCPDCGTKSNEDAKPQETAVAPQLGKYGETITPDGRKIFNSSKEAIEAASKSSAFFKVRSIFGTLSVLCILGAFLCTLIAIFAPDFALIKALIFPAVILGMNLIMPSTIMGIFAGKKTSKWFKEENVDIEETMRRGGATGKDALSARNLMIYKLLIDKPKCVVLDVVAGIINVFSLPYSFFVLGLFFTILPTIINGIRGVGSGLNIPNGQWIALAILFPVIVFTVASLIVSNITLSKARKNCEETKK